MTFTTSDLSRKINDYLSSLSYSREPEGLYEPIEYVLSMGGKRLRPLLMLMAYNLYNDDVDEVLPQAAAIEIYHNHTLLHDDVMDNADVRRGKPTVHKVWNENAAILSGDAMLILAYRYMCMCDADKLNDIVGVFTETAVEICEGQQWDMQFETMNTVSVEQYMEMIRLKTAVLLSAALKIGAIKAGACERDVQKLYDFGINVGLAFQLQDDYLDVYGDSKTFGKSIGNDIVSNKKTFMLLSALNRGTKAQKAELERWIAMESFDSKEKIEAVTEIYNELNINSLCFEMIDKYFDKGLSIFDSVDVEDDRKKVLKDFVMHMMRRKV